MSTHESELSLGSVPDLETFIEAEKTRETEPKTTENEHKDVDEFGSNDEPVEQLEDSIMEDDDEDAVKTSMAEEPEVGHVLDDNSAATPQIDTSYDFSDQADVLSLPKKRVPSYLQPTISYSQKIRAKYDPRSVSGSSQRSFSGSRTYSAEYHLREARLYEQRQNEGDVLGSRDGADSPDSSGSLNVPKRGGNGKQVKREFSREFTPSFPFNKENQGGK